MDDDEFFWDWVKHEDNIFTNRGSFFLLGETMLMAAVAALLAASKPVPRTWMIVIQGSGIFISTVWLYVSAFHVAVTQKRLKTKLADADSRSVGLTAHPWRIHSHLLMGIVLPAGVLIVWIVLLVTWVMSV